MIDQPHELPRVQSCQHRRWIASYPGRFRFHSDSDWRIDPTVCPRTQGILCLECGAELDELPQPHKNKIGQYHEYGDSRKRRRLKVAEDFKDWQYIPHRELSAAIQAQIDAGITIYAQARKYHLEQATIKRILDNPDGKIQIVYGYKISRLYGIEPDIKRIDGLPGDFRVCRIKAGYTFNRASVETGINGMVLGDIELGATSPDFYETRLRKFIEEHTNEPD